MTKQPQSGFPGTETGVERWGCHWGNKKWACLLLGKEAEVGSPELTDFEITKDKGLSHPFP